MANFITTPTAPTNTYIAGLTTEPASPNPVRWENVTPLKFYFDDTGARAWTEEERIAAVMAFGEWEAVANIQFILTEIEADADIKQKLTNSTEYAGQTSAPSDGINPPTIEYSIFDNQFSTLQPGGDTYVTIVHEIGHAIGLYHPHSGTTFPGVTLGQDQEMGTNTQNQQIYTVMSYVVGWTGQPVAPGAAFGGASGPMAFDIAAIQALYGAKSAETGNNTYSIPTANQIGTKWDAIWDTDGIDVITAVGVDEDTVIDLRAAPLEGANAGGFVTWAEDIIGGFTIANGVIIENAIGGSSDDTLIGNDVSNMLTGGKGDDRIDGGGLIDTALYTGDSSQFSLIISKGVGVTLQDRKTGGEGTDTLTNVENLDFSTGKDINLSLFEGVANVSAPELTKFIEMYIAYYNRAPDAEGLYFWGTVLNNGMSLPDIAANFFTQPETQALYPDTLATTEFVTSIYNNFLGRAPDTTGLDYWEKTLNSEAVTKGAFILAIIDGAKASTGSQIDVDYITGKANIGTYFSVIKGMSNTDNAKAAMALYDGTTESTAAAKNAIDGYYTTALDTSNGEFLMSIVGVLDDPFSIA